MRASTAILQEILFKASKLDAPQQTRDQFKQIVLQTGIEHGLRDLIQASRVDHARRLVLAGVSRPTARDRLIAFYGLSRRQAYRLIDAALNCAR